MKPFDPFTKSIHAPRMKRGWEIPSRKRTYFLILGKQILITPSLYKLLTKPDPSFI